MPLLTRLVVPYVSLLGIVKAVKMKSEHYAGSEGTPPTLILSKRCHFWLASKLAECTWILSVDSAESASARGCVFSSNMYDGTNLRCVCVGGGILFIYISFSLSTARQLQAFKKLAKVLKLGSVWELLKNEKLAKVGAKVLKYHGETFVGDYLLWAN